LFFYNFIHLIYSGDEVNIGAYSGSHMGGQMMNDGYMVVGTKWVLSQAPIVYVKHQGIPLNNTVGVAWKVE